MARFEFVWLAALAIAAAAGSSVMSTPSEDAVRQGKEEAFSLCSYCHLVAPDQPVPPTNLGQPTPSFTEIANGPKANAASIQRFVTTTHWDSQTFPMTMPRPFLLPEQTDRIVRYILSLRSGPPTPTIAPRTEAARRIERGEYVALQLCSYCHVVSGDTRYRPELQPAAPTFQSIADNPKNTAGSLGHFVTTTHWDERATPMKMPSQALSQAETDDVVAYILSKRTGK